MWLASDLDRLRGRWVAFDETTRGVLTSAETAEAHYELLDGGTFQRVTVIRVPRRDEPVYMGLLTPADAWDRVDPTQV